MAVVTGADGELYDCLLDTLETPGPQLRAVVTTLLIVAVDPPGGAASLIETMVASDDAAAMIDPAAAAETALRLRQSLCAALADAGAGRSEAAVVRVLRDHLLTQVERWATTSVDDADSRRRAERFLAWAERPEQLEWAQRRGLFAGMSVEEFRRLAERQASVPVDPETALRVWAEVDRWGATVDGSVGEAAIAAWEECRRRR